MCKPSMRCHALGWGGGTGGGRCGSLSAGYPRCAPRLLAGLRKVLAAGSEPPLSVLGTGSCPRPPAEPRGAQSGTWGPWGAAEVPVWVQPITVQRNHCWVRGRLRVLSPRLDNPPSAGGQTLREPPASPLG